MENTESKDNIFSSIDKSVRSKLFISYEQFCFAVTLACYESAKNRSIQPNDETSSNPKYSDLHENYSAKIDKDVIYLANRIKRKYELAENVTNKSE